MLKVLAAGSRCHAGWWLLGPLLIGGPLGWLFVRRQLSRSMPLLPVDLLRIPIFALSIGSSITAFAGQMLAMVSIPFYFQQQLGLNAMQTGLLMTPWPLATMVSAPLAGRLHSEWQSCTVPHNSNAKGIN